MNIDVAAAWMIRVFVYKSDRSEEWQILHPNAKDGKLYGDCEDFSLTLLYTIADGSKFKFWFYLVTFQAVMWHCKTDWGSHAQLWFRGKWIDNIDPTWRDKQPHSLSYPYPFPLVAYRMMTYKLSYIQSNILLVAICLIPLIPLVWSYIK